MDNYFYVFNFEEHPPMFKTVLILWGSAGDCPTAFDILVAARTSPFIKPGQMKQSAPAKSHLLFSLLGSEPELPPPPSFTFGTLVSRLSWFSSQGTHCYTHFLAPQSNWLSLAVVAGRCGAILPCF